MAISQEQLVTIGGMMGMDMYYSSRELTRLTSQHAMVTIEHETERRPVTRFEMTPDGLKRVQGFSEPTGKQVLHLQTFPKEPEIGVFLSMQDPKVRFYPEVDDDQTAEVSPEKALITDEEACTVVFDNSNPYPRIRSQGLPPKVET